MLEGQELPNILQQEGRKQERNPDGGVDLVLRRNGRVSVVQCKRYDRDPIGVEKVRELYGVMAARKADEAIFITTTSFTD